MKRVPLFICLILFGTKIVISQIHSDSLWHLGTPDSERGMYNLFDQNGNLYITGKADSVLNFDVKGGLFTGSNSFYPGYFLARYTPDLQIDRAYYYHYSGVSIVPTIMRTDINNNLIVGGAYKGSVDIDFDQQTAEYLSPTTNYSLFLIRYDSLFRPAGHFELVAQHDSFNVMLGDNSFISDIVIDHNNDIIISGYSGEVFVPSTSVNDTIKEFTFFIVKVDENFQLKWIKRFPKVVREFHNWTNFAHGFVNIDDANNIYYSISFIDSLDISGAGQNNYVSAQPFAYLNPPSLESQNIDGVIVKFDSNGNLIRHLQLRTQDENIQRILDAVSIDGKSLTVLLSFSGWFTIGGQTYYSHGYDSITEPNLALISFDTSLNILQSKQFHVRIIIPCPFEKYLQADECGNLFLQTSRIIANGAPFPAFTDETLPVIYPIRIYSLDANFNLSDSIYFNGFDLDERRFYDVSYGRVATFGTFSNTLSVNNITIQEVNYNPPNTGYDFYIAMHDYINCERKADPPVDDAVLELPNVFSPGSDNFNDIFAPKEIRNISEISIKIFNRWGRIIFEGKDKDHLWDGKNNSGQKCEDGVYFYLLSYMSDDLKKNKHGTISLFND
jgi:gliding motility-associated-like protein